MALAILKARSIFGRFGACTKFVTICRSPPQSFRQFSCVRSTSSVRQLRNGNSVHNRIVESRKKTFFPQGFVIARCISGGRQPKFSERKQSLIKRGLIFLAAFLLIHFLIIYVRYTSKRKGGKVQKVAPFAVETIYDSDLKCKFSVINGYKLPDFVSSKTFEDIYNFRVHPDDVYVVSFPKSGTTWVQEIVYLVNNCVDTETAKCINMENRFPYLEYVYPGVKEISKKLGGRLIKSHLPLSLLPQGIMDRKAKVIYISRNPKDTSVSYYHYARMLNVFKYKRPFNDFFDRYVEGNVPYGPWWNHYSEFWENRQEENILFVFYEDLQKDIKSEIRRIANFMRRSLTDEQVNKIAEHCSFGAMQNNPAANYTWWDNLGLRDKNETQFLRKGKVGDWHNYYSEEQCERMNKICDEKFKDNSLHFTYDV